MHTCRQNTHVHKNKLFKKDFVEKKEYNMKSEQPEKQNHHKLKAWQSKLKMHCKTMKPQNGKTRPDGKEKWPENQSRKLNLWANLFQKGQEAQEEVIKEIIT